MSAEISDKRQWVEDSLGHFVRAIEIANKIGIQNQLHSELVESGQVTLKPFQEATTDFLTEEQAQTFQDLLEAGATAPYEEITKRDSQLYSALGRVAAQLSSIEEQQKEETALIHKEEELVAGRIPELAPKLSEIATRLEQGLIAKEKERLESEQAELKSVYEALCHVYEVAGQSWPIPRLISTKQEQTNIQIIEPEEPKQADDLIEVDDFPEEKHLTKEQVAEKVRRKYPDEILKDASEFVALFLAEEPKYIYTLDELADVIYGAKEENRKSRVSALISNFELGKTNIIGYSLRQQGLVFQRGERKSYRKRTGKLFGRCHPVFRAVSIKEADCKERIVHSEETVDWVNDGWHTVIFDTSKPRINDGVVSQEVATLKTTEILKDGDGRHEPVQTTVPQQVETPTQPIQKTKKRSEPKWKVEFNKAVRATIAQFEDDGLMSEGELSWKLVRVKSSSRIIATQRAAEKAINYHIINRNESNIDSELPVAKFICMALQNGHPDIFSNPYRQEQAIALVEEAVSQYFEAVNKRS